MSESKELPVIQAFNAVSVGTTRYYRLTEHGRRVLSLLTDSNSPIKHAVQTDQTAENVGG